MVLPSSPSTSFFLEVFGFIGSSQRIESWSTKSSHVDTELKIGERPFTTFIRQ